jgi:hypothetical protein
MHALVLESVLAGDVDISWSQDGDDLVFRQHDAHGVIPLDAFR